VKLLQDSGFNCSKSNVKNQMSCQAVDLKTLTCPQVLLTPINAEISLKCIVELMKEFSKEKNVFNKIRKETLNK